MYKNNIISKIAALLLLLLFVIGNAPIQLLHDTFANHKDYSSGVLASSDKAQLVQKAIHCQCDHFVVDSSFSIPVSNFHFGLPLLISGFSSSLASVLFTKRPSFFSLRGPPITA